MQHAGQLLNLTTIRAGTTSQTTASQKPQKATSTTSDNVKPVSKRIERLFSRFAVIYGHLWQSQYKSEAFITFAKREWEDGLRRFDDTMVNNAIEAARSTCEKPPTLSQVIEFCRMQERAQKMYRDTQPAERASPEVARRHLANIREILNQPTRKTSC